MWAAVCLGAALRDGTKTAARETTPEHNRIYGFKDRVKSFMQLQRFWKERKTTTYGVSKISNIRNLWYYTKEYKYGST